MRNSVKVPQPLKEVPHLTAMEIDPVVLPLEHTQRPPESSSTRTSTQETPSEMIKVLIKKHVKLWEEFLQAQTANQQDAQLLIIQQAQQSQQVLQKLIPKKELESYVSNWNPWEAKRKLLTPKNKRNGKNKSSISQTVRNYQDPNRWAQGARMAAALKGVFNTTK